MIYKEQKNKIEEKLRQSLTDDEKIILANDLFKLQPDRP